MLKKIPPDPLIGSCRVVRKFTWKKIETLDKYYASFRFVFNVEQYTPPSRVEMMMHGVSKASYSKIGVYALRDNAEAAANMLTLQCVKQDNV